MANNEQDQQSAGPAGQQAAPTPAEAGGQGAPAGPAGQGAGGQGAGGQGAGGQGAAAGG